MLEHLKQISEALTSILGLAGIILLGYIIAMGLVYKQGKEKWLAKEQAARALRGLPVLKRFAGTQKSEPFWKDPDLIKAGSRAFSIVCILSSYVVIMLLFMSSFAIEKNRIMGAIAVLLGYPNIMLAFIICRQLFVLKMRANRSLIPMFVLAVLFMVLSILIFTVLPLKDNFMLLYQLVILCCLSLIQSNIFGINAGIKEAEIDSRFPAVELQTMDGKLVADLRFSGNTESDYKFICPDGSECIIPSAQVHSIKILQEKKDSPEKK